MNVQSALDVLKQKHVIDRFDSRVAAIVNIRENDFAPEFVESVLTDICKQEFESEPTAFDAEFIIKEPNNVDREREIFNKYLLGYLTTELIKSREKGISSFKETYRIAVDNAIKNTTERLYGDLKWIDAGLDEKKEAAQTKTKTVDSKTQKTETRKARGTSTPQAPKAGGKVATVFARVLVLYRDEKKTRKETVAALMSEFSLNKEVTAVTYFNDCLKLHGIAKRAE